MQRAVQLMMDLAETVFEQKGQVRLHLTGTSFVCKHIQWSTDRLALRGVGVDDAEVVVAASAVIAIEEIAASYD